MNHNAFLGNKSSTPLAFLLAIFGASTALAQPTTNAPMPVLQIQADHVTAKMPPTFYGLMTEEINYSYEGGLYGELVRNRTFKADAISSRNHQAGRLRSG